MRRESESERDGDDIYDDRMNTRHDTEILPWRMHAHARGTTALDRVMVLVLALCGSVNFNIDHSLIIGISLMVRVYKSSILNFFFVRNQHVFGMGGAINWLGIVDQMCSRRVHVSLGA